MNSILKNLALLIFLCLGAGLSAQSLKSATVSSNGLIVLDNTSTIGSEYVASISHLGLTSETAANDFFKKYIDYTNGRGMSFSFDLQNQKMYIILTPSNQTLVPLSNQGVTVSNFNDILKWIHQGII